MELRPGYKQTEVGVIPEEWDVMRLSEVTDLQVGFAFKSEWFGETIGTRLLRGENVGYGIADWSETRTLESKSDNAFRAYLLNPGDVVIGMDRTFTKSGVKITMLREGDCPCLLVQRVGRFIPQKCDQKFLWFVLSSEQVQSRLRLEQKGMDIPHLSRTEILYPLAIFPSPPEQRAIATVLSDVDALLSTMNQLIAKKRDLKQAAMQQLLTGETRLPGFQGKWEVKRLGEVLTVCHGKSQRDVEVTDGPYPILATGGQIGTASRALYEKPSVLIGRKGTINQPQYMDTPFWTVDTLFYSVLRANNVAKFFYYRFCLIDWMQFNEASGVPSLNARTIESIQLKCPGPEEQTAIADVLTEMDAELAALEKRREKTRALKQAMMQELLVGRTRLVTPKVTHD